MLQRRWGNGGCQIREFSDGEDSDDSQAIADALLDFSREAKVKVWRGKQIIYSSTRYRQLSRKSA